MSTGARVEPGFEATTDGWAIPSVQDLSAWGLSLGAHVVILVVLALIHFEVAGSRPIAEITSVMDDVEPDLTNFDSTMTDQVGSGAEVSNSLTVATAAASPIARDPQAQVERELDNAIVPNIPVQDQIVKPSQGDLLAPVETVGTNEVTGGVEGALDRLSWEIANSLREKKTAVVWLFDVSPSLSKRRQLIADRVETIYRQLNSLNVTSDKALKTAIATFGAQTRIVTKDPLDSIDEVVKTVREIKSEESGVENVFAAVNTVATRFQSLTREKRQIMVIVVTDEAGSDPQNLEAAIAFCKRYDMRVYCVGEMSPFGTREVEVPFTLDSGEQVIGVMQRGPEAYYQERVNLPFFGVNAGGLDQLPSGFGPYALTRLCAETNGLYFITDPGSAGRIDLSVMRGYAPDYRPIRLLDQDIASNSAKRAIIEIAEKLKVDGVRRLQTEFRAESDDVLRSGLAEAQKPLAEFDYRIEQVQKILEGAEKDRAKLRELRWQANFDVAMGRTLALRVRGYGYNVLLAEMRSSPKPFTKPGSNQWRLVPGKEITAGAQVKKMATKAQEYLKRVVDDHAGTPWALLAERELSQPMGWEWQEATYTPPTQMMGNGKQKLEPRFVEEVDPKTGKKTKRQLPDAPVRREI